jgi:3,4-dihydroxy 2-butanone 4-phosphate synthase/GTP cyclohydrolase II
VRLLTNNPEKVRQLEEHGVEVEERVPLVVGVGAFNEGYLETKRDRMGHAIGAIDQSIDPDNTDTAAAVAAERTTR